MTELLRPSAWPTGLLSSLASSPGIASKLERGPGQIWNRTEIEFSFSSLGQKVDNINVSAHEQYSICHVVYFAFNIRFKLKIPKLSARFAGPCGLFGA